MVNVLEEKTKEKTVKRKKNYYLVKSDVLGYAKRKGLINDLSGILFFSLITGIGYDYISKRYWIPIARKDFQGYRRKVLDEMYRWILWGEHDDGKMAERLFGIKRHKHGNTTEKE